MIKYNNNSLFYGEKMAKPRIFLSSTFYDLKQIRFDLDRFIRDLGYEAVRNEQGEIPFSKEKTLEDSCYKEIETVDIVVSIVGGRFGATSVGDSQYSISQREIHTALKLDKQVFIFIDKNVYSEYRTYLVNKENATNMRFHFADNIKIFQHIEYLESLPKNNVICPFESSSDIINYLKEQFAGLFQRFLQQQKKIKEVNLIEQLASTSTSLQKMVDYFSQININHNENINDLVLSNHPAMFKIKELLDIKYRVFFLSMTELTSLLAAHGFEVKERSSEIISFSKSDEKSSGIYTYFIKEEPTWNYHLFVNESLFDTEGKLKPISMENWNKDCIYMHEGGGFFPDEDYEHLMAEAELAGIIDNAPF